MVLPLQYTWVQERAEHGLLPSSKQVSEEISAPAKKRARFATSDWNSDLPWALLSLQIASKEGSNISAELVYGSTLTVLGDFLGLTETHIRRFCIASAQPYLNSHRRRHVDPSLNYFPDHIKRTRIVFMRHDGTRPVPSPLYHGLCLVLKRGPKTLRLKIGSQEDTVSVDRLKASNYEEMPSPLLRGRPK